jgi:hypothetical protein
MPNGHEPLQPSSGGANAANTPPWPIYVLGVGVTLFAFFMVYEAFQKTCLTSQQMTLLRFVLPLAGGFIAWTFAGQMTAKAKKLGLGLTVAASGGFAVFLLSVLLLEPNVGEEGKGSCAAQGPNRSQVLLRDFATNVANVNAHFSELKIAAGNRENVHREAVGLVGEGNALPDSELRIVERILKTQYLAQLQLICALTIDVRVKSAIEDGARCAAAAIRLGEDASKLIAAAEHEGSSAQERAEVSEFVAKKRTREKIVYVEGLAAMFLHLVAEDHQIGDKTTMAVVLRRFEPLSYDFLKQHNASTEEVMQWFCKKYPQQARLCAASV